MQARRILIAVWVITWLTPAVAQETTTSIELAVIDLRPDGERDGTGLTPLPGKCNKGVFRIADVASDPLKVPALKSNLTQLLGLVGDGKTLTVLNWSIYYNQQTPKGGMSLNSIGVQGYGIPGKKKEKQAGSRCARNESAGGWYEGGEVSTRFAPLVSEFEGTFAGKRVSVRVVHSPAAPIDGEFLGSESDTGALLDTVLKTAEALAASIT